ncbi:amidinotransferase [Nonlabens sp. Ci31]|jgi:N-dimethylarginine dimethylaminohydrolase|uniref:dimethylarginine dimethylaminohydrolase family protein n=1 Tax=Nonlabens sp. Ci31 TaxID=2608253 RepID=UPI00146489BA|nr:arginine deiminase family protein [Nonlabens sp. Ci31]QJP34508.1 amidinotransferase [Nonlabens sp. Ci31]
MEKIDLHVTDETSRLRSVVLGTARSNGPVPSVDDAYDPKSREHIIAGTYPSNEDMVNEMEAVAAVLKRYNVSVLRPKQIENCNQIFTRDIGFVIDNMFVKANILPDREEELDAIQYIVDQMDPDNVIRPPEEVHIEGGDVMLYGEYIFVGTYRGRDYTDHIIARTNVEAVAWLKETFPHKKVVSFNLRKDNLDPYNNALHLDCCFQPVGDGKCIIHRNGFLQEEEYQYLVNFFGRKNCFEITREEMYHMNSNIFSIAPDVVVSEKNFTRLNAWLRSHGITVEEVPYAEISKQEGLLRCSTLPLIRD